MGLRYNTKISKDGLILYLDAANSKSTSGPGVQWNNLVAGDVLSSTGTPSLTTLGGADCYRFTAAGQYFSSSISALSTDAPDTELTMEAWIYPETEITAGDRGNICRINAGQPAYLSWNKSNLKLSNYWYGHTPAGYHETGAAMTRNNWHHVCAVWNGSTLYQYTNMVQTSVSVTGTAAANGSITVGHEGDSRQFAGGIAVIRVYNIALEYSEVYANYLACRGRFGA